MDTFLAVIVVFGGLIALGVITSVYLYNSGAIGIRRFRIRRVTPQADILSGNTREEIMAEDEIVDAR